MRQRVLRFCAAALLVCSFVATVPLHGQDQDLNTYYRFPLSVGVEYQSYSPFAEYGASYNIFELSGSVRWPIPLVPVLQPLVKGGMR